MKTLLILAFSIYALPSQAVTVETVVCVDHVKREANVYRNVKVNPATYDLPFEEANEIICERLKRLNKKGN